MVKRKRGGSVPPTPERKLPVPTLARKAGYVRLFTVRPDGTKLYYNAAKADYVEGKDYSRWPIADWRRRFASRADIDGLKQWTDPEGRQWEFFGYIITLYD